MSYTLLIAEKPDMARAFADFLFAGKKVTKQKTHIECDDTIVTWAFGHILEQAQPTDYDEKYSAWDQYPIFPDPWKLKITPSSKAQFKAIQSLLKDAKEVIHGGDPDREGQLLIDEILNYCKYKGPVKRLLANAKDTDSLRRAFADLKDNAKYKSLYEAGLARQRADWLVGMNLTRAYSVNARRFGYTETFKVGRVKTPTLALVVQRENEIKNFKPVKHYVLEATFMKDQYSFKAKHRLSDKIDTDSEGRVLDAAVIAELCQVLQGQPGYVVSATTKAGKTEPPLPHSLDTLQIQANKLFGYSPKDVLATVQSMYEKAYVSYPRSDCNYIPTSQAEDAPAILNSLRDFFNLPLLDEADSQRRSKAFNDKKITAHHAIIPTKVMPSGLSAMEQAIYKLIAIQYAIQFFPPETFNKTELEIDVKGERFTASGKQILDPGYKKIYGKSDDDSESEPTLPVCSENDPLAGSYEVVERTTTPPKRFTEGSLIKAMANIYQFVDKTNPMREKLKEVKGIGTPATRDTIISELLATKSGSHAITPFLTKKGKDLIPTDWGMQFISIIDTSLTKPDTTAVMEYALSEITEGKENLSHYMDEIQKLVTNIIHSAQTSSYPVPLGNSSNGQPKEHITCPFCGGVVVQRKTKATGATFYICSNKECVSPHTGKPVFYKDSGKGPVMEPCPKCGTLLQERKGPYGFFWGCPNPDCKASYPSDKKGLPNFNAKTKKKG